MNKFKRGDLCRCVEGFEDLSRRIVGRVGEVEDIEQSSEGSSIMSASLPTPTPYGFRPLI